MTDAHAWAQAALDTVDEAIVVLDGDGRITYVNRSWEAFIAASVAADSIPSPIVVGDDWFERAREAVRHVGGREIAATVAAAIEGVQGVLAGHQERFVLEARWPWPDRPEHGWVQMRVRRLDPAGAVISHHDLTERITAQREAEARDEQFQTLLQASSDAIAVIEPDGSIRYVSPAITSLLGRIAKDSRSGLSLIRPEDLGHVISAFRTRLQTAGVSAPVEFRARHADGTWRDLEVVTNNLVDHPAVRGLVLTIRDVTERKRTAGELVTRASQQALVANLGRRALASTDLTALLSDIVEVVAEALAVDWCHVLEDVPGGSIPWAAFGAAPGPPTGEVAIVIRDHPFGRLAVGGADGAPLGTDDRRFLETVANVIAAAIERSRAEAENRHRAMHDPLTGLPNRTLLMDRLGRAIGRIERRATTVAVLFLDLDNFKVINDTLGHSVGDEILVALGGRLQHMVRPTDTVARFGGDEFVILCEELRQPEDATILAARVIETISEPIVLESSVHHVTASVGVAQSSVPTTMPDALLRDADTAMYRAKARGRSRWELFDEMTRQRLMNRLETETALRRAVQHDELRLRYQPLVRLPSGRLSGVECLVRWARPGAGLLEPASFVTLAEETGQIEAIGEWVLGEACRQGAVWRRLNPGLQISVNLSARQLSGRRLIEVVAANLDDTGMEPEGLVLEITESVLMEDVVPMGNVLTELKDLGVTLAVDDFGTGYSSLSHLKRFPVDTLKVDRSFVAGLGHDAEDDAIVSAVVGLAESLRLDCIAEGVETHEQRRLLERMGCGGAQGWLFGRPQTDEAITALLKESGSAGTD